MRCRFSRLAVLGLLLLLAAGAGCDARFEPYAETDRQFSMFGLLNPEQSRHCVRVERLQDGVPFAPDTTLDATATLARRSGGEAAVTLEERLIRTLDTKLVRNFCGALDLKLDATYRLAVQGAGGESSAVTTTMPHDVPVLSLALPREGLTITVEGGTQDQLFYLEITYHVTVQKIGRPPQPPPIVTDFLVHRAQQAEETETGYAFSYDWEEAVRNRFSGPAIAFLEKIDVAVALAHPSTPTYEGLSYKALLSPGVPPSNIEDGIGFVPGATNDRVSHTFSNPPEVGFE